MFIINLYYYYYYFYVLPITYLVKQAQSFVCVTVCEYETVKLADDIITNMYSQH